MIIRRIVLISRPRFWIYLLGPYIVGYVAGASNLSDFLSLPFWYGFFFFLIPANIFLYGVNDFFDTDTDSHNKKKGTKEYLMKTDDRQFYMKVILFSLALSFPLFLFLDTVSQYILAIFFLLSFFYSAPPLRFKAKPFLDFMSNILYILPGVAYYIHLTNQYPSMPIILAAFCWTGAMHLYSAVPDIEADKKVHLTTTAVLLGKRNSLILCMFLWGITAFIASGITHILSVAWVYPLLISAVISGYLPLEKIYWYFPWINMVLGFLLFLYVSSI